MGEKRRLRRRCASCGSVYTVGDGISWQVDPFAADVHGDRTKHWLCDSCADESAMEI
jgi:hypothetical protein